jgi:tRNA A-37 threonylcarbamoyl transferase component Bud32
VARSKQWHAGRTSRSVKLLSRCVQKRLLGLVMERVPGRDCRDMKPADFRRLKERAVAALERLWEAGFVHGDVAPRNIMLANDGSVRLVDMGMSRHVGKGAREIMHERLYVNNLFDKGIA